MYQFDDSDDILNRFVLDNRGRVFPPCYNID